jgi:2,3-diketo-5-methylthiopentyl-1-phosphate enolase
MVSQVLSALAADQEINVPIFAHPALAGAMCASPDYGMAYSVVLGTLMAHGGADAVLYPAHYGNLPFDPAEEIRIRDSLRSRNVFPVPSAGIHPGVVPKALSITVRMLFSTRVLELWIIQIVQPQVLKPFLKL